MAHESLSVELRSSRGKGQARKMRAAGRIPAVLYGHGNEPTSLSLNPSELDKLLRNSAAGVNTLIDLAGGVTGKTVLIKDVQREPVRGNLTHIDFYAIDATEKLLVDVPLVLTGAAHGVEIGGVLDQLVRELQISCLPDSIPDSIEFDVTAMEIGDTVHASDLTMPAGATLESDPTLLVLSCDFSRAAVAEADAEEEAAEAAAEGEGEAGEGDDDEKKKGDD